MRMVTQIDELLSVVLHLGVEQKTESNFPPAVLHNIGKFAEFALFQIVVL